jgi:hypothetical protein
MPWERTDTKIARKKYSKSWSDKKVLVGVQIVLASQVRSNPQVLGCTIPGMKLGKKRIITFSSIVMKEARDAGKYVRRNCVDTNDWNRTIAFNQGGV